MALIDRLSAVVLSLALVAGNAAVCAGWAATPEARMACCAEGGECARHNGRSPESGPEHVHTQAEADACCAASEREHSNPSNATAVEPISAAALGVAVVLPPLPPSLMLTDGWRTNAPIHSPPVPRHVLLSVFLV